MIDRDELLDIHEGTVESKEHLWFSHNERDMAPMVMISPEGHMPHQAAGGCKAGPEPDLQTILKLMNTTMPTSVRGTIESVFVAVDAHQDQVNELPSSHRHGDLAHDFATNPASTVSEVIMTTVATNDRCGGCDIVTVQQPYAITDGGVFKWGQVTIIEESDEAGGEVYRLIRKLFSKEVSS